jgi:DNA primase
MKNVLELLESKGISSKKASSTKGGEYHSACPGCGGDDRFHVWPEQNEGAGSWWCRQCGKGGDAIQFLRDFDGMSYPEACRALDVDLPGKEQFRTPHVKSKKGGAPGNWQPSGGDAPAALWRERADKLVAWSHEQLLENKTEMRRLLERGITKKLAKEFVLGWMPEDKWRHRKSWGLPEELKKNGKVKRLWIPSGLVIPMIQNGHAARIRIRRPAGEPRYYALPGSNMDCLVVSENEKDRLAVVVESELDAILLVRYVDDLSVIIALGNSSRKPDAAAADKLGAADLILLAVDYDTGGNNQVVWWLERFPRTKHWPVPAGKDPGDAHKAGIDLRSWVVAGCPTGWLTSPSLLGVHPDPAPVPEKVRDSSAAMAERVVVPSGVLQLQELLKNTPVVIENTADRTSIRAPQRWSDQFWEKSKQISQLVYFDPEVFSWITNHPDQKIMADNLIKQ